MVHSQQFVVGARGVGRSGPFGATHGVPLAGCRSWFAIVRRVSVLLHKDSGQVPVVNGEEEASPPSYPPPGVPPWGTSCLRRSETSPKLSGPSCRAVSYRNVVARTLSLDHATDGLASIAAGKAHGKIVVKIND